jgi:uncharacterized membrane protein
MRRDVSFWCNVKLTFTWHLVADAKQWWKWHSIKLLAAGGVMQGAVVAADATGFAQHIQPIVLTVLSDFALVCTVLAGLARITAQPGIKEYTDEPHKPVQS